MMRGVNKLVVEIQNPESEYFERAILFVKPQKQDVSRREIQKEANQLINSFYPKPRRRFLNVVLPILILLCGLGLIVCGTLLMTGNTLF